jgi:hypothetical protein
VEKLGDSDLSNSDTAQFDLSQFGSWYLLAGIECYAESAMEVCSCETLLLELDRLEAFEKAHCEFHDAERFAELRERIESHKADLQAWDSHCDAQLAREQFRVIEGGKKN